LSEDCGSVATLRLVLPQTRERSDEMLTPGQVAKLLGISSHTVHEEIRAGRLGCYRFGVRCIRVSTDQLNGYLQSRKSNIS
jgi:excisionase family DNA binding protein